MSNIKYNVVATAGIAVALSLAVTSLAQAQEGSEQTRATAIALKRHAVTYKIYNAAPDPSKTAVRFTV
jgi:hypothetical protein